jgi:tRNA-modifying protein YgfZ
MMPRASIAHLSDRGVVQASGADAGQLLDSLITSDMDQLGAHAALHAGLLSPQGKILFAFFVVKSGGDFLLDVARDRAADLAKRLNFYKLRAAAQFTDISADVMVVASWHQPPPGAGGFLAYADPRSAELGHRLILPAARACELGAMTASADDYHALRVLCGVPEEGRDYPLGDAFPHEANFDLLHGVSFTKGCYVGQEVVSRMQNKTVVRKRIVPIGGTDLRSGVEITHGAGVIGTIGTVAGDKALAMLRLDRAVEAADKGQALMAGGSAITVAPAALERYRASVLARPVVDL